MPASVALGKWMPPLPELPEPAPGAQYDLETLNRYDERTLIAWGRAYGIACYLSGAHEMRERAAKECEAARTAPQTYPEYCQACDDCAAAIRALPIADE